MTPDRFDPDDIAQICSRRSTGYRMKKNDYKELIRNVQMGSIDLIASVLKALGFIIISIPEPKESSTDSDGYRDGHCGYGFYIGDIKVDDRDL